MIQIENSSFPLENGFDCIIPFEIHLQNNEIIINAYDIVEYVAEEFNTKFSRDYLSDEALIYLNEQLNPIVKKYGYEFDEKRLFKWNYAYKMTDVTQLNKSLILTNTIKWNESIELVNLTTIDFDYIGERNMFVTLINNKIVSYACENSIVSDVWREIGVETASDFRGNGYAASNTAALAMYGLQLNYEMKYNCSRNNIASQRIAEKVGFIKDGKSYYYVCYKE